MQVRVLARGAVEAELVAALRRAGHEVHPTSLPEVEEPAPSFGAALAVRPVDAVLCAGLDAADAPWRDALCTALGHVPIFDVDWADPPDPRAASLLGPLLAGRGKPRLAVRGPGERPLDVTLPLRIAETGGQLLARALDAAVARVEAHLEAPGDAGNGADARRPAPNEPGPDPLEPEIDWSAPARAVARRIRAWTAPLPGARCTLAGAPVTLLTAEWTAWRGPESARPGAVALERSGACIRCGRGAVRVLAARVAGVALDRNDFATWLRALGSDARAVERPRRLLPFGVPALGREEEAALLRTLRSRWIGTGPAVERLEHEFCEATGARHAVAVSSCTAALHLALLAADVGPGHEVVTTALTFVATVNAIAYTGARPALVDVDPDTLNLDPEAVEAALTPRTRAIVAVHFGGRPCDMTRLRTLAARHGIPVVEDAAHAVGATYATGRPVGSGPFDTCFSFYPNKNLTSCEGGMITTRSAERARRFRRMRMHGLTADAWKRFGTEEIVRSRMIELGYKYNLTDLQAALGRVQLAKLERFTAIRNEQAGLYREAFADLERVRPLPALPVGRERHAYHLFTVRIEGIGRDRAQVELRGRGIGAAIHYEPVHLHPYWRDQLDVAPGSLPVAEAAGASTLTLPIGPSLTRADLGRVIEAVRALESLPAERRRPRAGSDPARRVSPAPCPPRPTTSPTG